MNEPVRILHVDDDPDLVETVATYLEREDQRFQVATATSATEGLDHLAEGDFDCVIADYAMAGTDGLEFLSLVRDDYPDLPFVLYTGKGSEEVASEAIAAGVTDYLQKGTGTTQYSMLANRVGNAVEQRRARRQVEATQVKLRQLAENTDDVLYMVDGDWSELLFINSTYEEMWGGSIADLEADPSSFLDHVHPEDRDTARRSMEKLRAGQPDELEYRVITEDGQRRWVRGESKPLFDEDGDVYRIVGFVRDVTERVERERQLEKYETLVESMEDPAWVLDREKQVTLVNQATVERVGVDRGEVVGQSIAAFEPLFGSADDFDAYEAAVNGLLAGEVDDVEIDVAFELAAGRAVVDLRLVALRGDGQIDGVVGIGRDITERVERERELERYETIVQTSGDPIFVVDRAGRFVQLNDALVELVGHDRDELLGEHFSVVADEEYVRRAGELVEELHEGEREEASFEAPLVDAVGSPRQHVTSLSLLGPEGAADGTVFVAHDVADLRTHQRRLSVLDRILRHNLRNKMNVVAGQAEQIRGEADEAIAERAATIRNTATNLLELSESARQFEDVIERTSPQTATVDVAEMVRRVVADARLEHPEADLRVTAPTSAPAVGHETIGLAITELVENAIEHSDRDGPTVDVHVDLGEAEVDVVITDEGPGLGEVDRRALRRGAESPLEHSQGLGLWLVRWTVENAGGDVEFARNEPRGTVVTITLPRADEG